MDASRAATGISEVLAIKTVRFISVSPVRGSTSSGNSLAYKRHFPAINWLTSHSLYLDSLKPWFDENLGKEFLQNREQAMGVLQRAGMTNSPATGAPLAMAPRHSLS